MLLSASPTAAPTTSGGCRCSGRPGRPGRMRPRTPRAPRPSGDPRWAAVDHSWRSMPSTDRRRSPRRASAPSTQTASNGTSTSNGARRTTNGAGNGSPNGSAGHQGNRQRSGDDPVVFLKPNTSVIGPEDPIRLPAGVGRVDHDAPVGHEDGEVPGWRLRPEEPAHGAHLAAPRGVVLLGDRVQERAAGPRSAECEPRGLALCERLSWARRDRDPCGAPRTGTGGCVRRRLAERAGVNA